uniref:Lysosomal membrane ascorbate-dependent ferrireductase CYB561A3 n=1 Tax=Sinocyclocheilus grahami TaxID=75366 RepID=A0A672NBH5_SINGR
MKTLNIKDIRFALKYINPVIFCLCFRSVSLGGFAWDESFLQFNLHPFLMVTSLVVLYGNAIVLYRVPFTWSRWWWCKRAHAGLLFVAMVLSVLGVCAAFDFHIANNIPHLCSLHSWTGISTVALFTLQVQYTWSSLIEMSQYFHCFMLSKWFVGLWEKWNSVCKLIGIAVVIFGLLVGSTAVKKPSGRPRLSSKHQDRLLLRTQLWNHVTSSAELAQEWQQVGVRASASTVRPRLLDNGLVSRRAAKKPLLFKKNVKGRLKFCRKYRIGQQKIG